jgi:hypothetical protein
MPLPPNRKRIRAGTVPEKRRVRHDQDLADRRVSGRDNAEADRTGLAILRRSDMKPTAKLHFEKNVHISEFYWVSPKTVMFSIAQKFGDLEKPQGSGELYKINADGTGRGPR